MGPELRTLEPALHELRERIASREALVGVVGLGAVGEGNLPQVEQVIVQLVNLFCDDYLEMNDPRR